MKFYVIEITTKDNIYCVAVDNTSGGYPYVTDVFGGKRFTQYDIAFGYFKDYYKESIPSYSIPEGFKKGIMDVSLIEVSMDSYRSIYTNIVDSISRYIGD